VNATHDVCGGDVTPVVDRGAPAGLYRSVSSGKVDVDATASPTGSDLATPPRTAVELPTERDPPCSTPWDAPEFSTDPTWRPGTAASRGYEPRFETGEGLAFASRRLHADRTAEGWRNSLCCVVQQQTTAPIVLDPSTTTPDASRAVFNLIREVINCILRY
jgi:hypothetical protein